MTWCVYLLIDPNSPVVYVGMTRWPKERWKQHQRAARRGDPHPLYAAMGRARDSGFRFHVVKRGLAEREARDFERIYIVYHQRNGGVYNQPERWGWPTGLARQRYDDTGRCGKKFLDRALQDLNTDGQSA